MNVELEPAAEATDKQSQPPGDLSLEDFLKELGEEYEQAQTELKEINVLIAQSSTEIENLVQRNTRIASKLRQIETHLETVPREDIKNAYTTHHEAQMRLFMMRSQLEQLQSKQQSLERYSQRIRTVLGLSGELFSLGPQLSDQVSQATESQKGTIIQIIQAQETERQHLARQMHDGPAQSLSNLVLQAEVCERLLDKDPSQVRAELKSLKSAVNTTFQKTRSFIFDLRPMMLDDLGLVPTLKRYVEELETKSGFQTSLNVIGSEARFESHTEVIVFRAVQVLLDNVREHAQASRAQVTLDIMDDNISVTVEDNGSGFSVDEALQRAEEHKVSGLTNVMDQVKMLGGTLDIDSKVGRGTVVTFSVPLG